MTGIPCRRCGKAGTDATLLWKPAANGSLEAYAAQCRQPCTVPAAASPRHPARSPGPPRPVVISATRPGICPACTWDIVPGDKIVSPGGGGYVHLECAPGGARVDEGDAAGPVRRVGRRERPRVR